MVSTSPRPDTPSSSSSPAAAAAPRATSGCSRVGASSSARSTPNGSARSSGEGVARRTSHPVAAAKRGALVEERGLAEPRRGFQHDNATAAADGGAQGVQLDAALDQGGVRSGDSQG